MRLSGLFLFIFAALTAEAQQWEEFYHQGELVERMLPDDRGRPREMEIFRQGRLAERRSYVYGEGTVSIGVASFDREGEETNWTDILTLNGDGSLRKMVRRREGETFLRGWSSDSLWKQGEGQEEITLFNEEGEPLSRRIFLSGLLTQDESYVYDSLGRLVRSEILQPEKGLRTVTAYDEGERKVKELFYREGLLLRQISYAYDALGRPVETTTRGEGRWESWTGLYDEGDKLLSESFYSGGVLTRTVRYGEKGRTEEIYTRGKLSLKITYEEGVIVNEERYD